MKRRYVTPAHLRRPRRRVRDLPWRDLAGAAGFLLVLIIALTLVA